MYMYVLSFLEDIYHIKRIRSETCTILLRICSDTSNSSVLRRMYVIIDSKLKFNIFLLVERNNFFTDERNEIPLITYAVFVDKKKRLCSGVSRSKKDTISMGIFIGIFITRRVARPIHLVYLVSKKVSLLTNFEIK